MGDINIAEILINSIIEFFGFIGYHKIAGVYIIGFCVSTIMAANIGLLMLAMRLHDRRVLEKYKREPKPEPLLVYRYSESGELRIYENGCRISRVGSFVSNALDHIKDISTVNKDENDRIISVTYIAKNNELKTEEIHCGVMNIFEFLRIKEYMLQYSGG